MRIISGQFRRRTLLSNPGLTTRPITDRVKETLFERIEQSLVDAKVADIFAGTGTIGLEALSRGAASVVFVEKDTVALELLRKNISTLGVEDSTLAWNADVFRCSYKPKGVAAAFSPFDVIFFDPPYKMAEKLLPGSPLFLALSRLTKPEVSAPDARLFLRVAERCEYELPPEWKEEWVLSMSNMEIHVYRKTG